MTHRTVQFLITSCITYLFPIHEHYLVVFGIATLLHPPWSSWLVGKPSDVSERRSLTSPPLQKGMHRTIEIDEILRSIAERIGDSSPKSAVSFPCCCKVLDKPALNHSLERYPRGSARLDPP